MDSFWGIRSMHTLRKLPTARPKTANMIIRNISTVLIVDVLGIEVNSQEVLLPDAASSVIVGTFLSTLPGWRSQPKQSRCENSRLYFVSPPVIASPDLSGRSNLCKKKNCPHY